MVQARIVVLQAFQLVVGRFQCFVGHHQHVDTLFQLDLGDFGALLIEQERGHVDGHLAHYRGGVVFERLFLDDAQNLQRAGFGVADVAGTTAAWARNRSPFGQRGAQTLAAHFHQAKLADGAKLHAGTVLPQGVTQTVFNIAAVARLFHVDKVDHDQAAQIAQAHLAGHFFGGFQVGAGGGFFDVATADRARGVDIHRHQRFGVVDNDGAAAWQLHGAGIGRLDLVFDLEAAEQRCVIAVAFDTGSVLGHHVGHELLGLLVHVVGVDQDVANIGIEVVADGADHQAGFLVNQKRALALLASAINGGPQLEQVVQVPLQLRRAAANAGGTGDDAGAVGVFQLVHSLFQLGPVVTFDTARNATATGVVGHQHHIAAGQRHKGRQGCALVAALFFFDLDQQFLAFTDGVLDAGLAGRNALGEVLFGDFLERQKAVAVFAVIDKAGFQRGLDAGDDSLVDIALALFASLYFNLIVEQFLPVHNRQPTFFGLGCVNQHPFHGALSLTGPRGSRNVLQFNTAQIGPFDA